MNCPQLITLTENETACFARTALPEWIEDRLWPQYKAQVSIDLPSKQTEYQWKLTPASWIGYLPLSEELHIALRPKVPIANLFRMLEYAFRIDFLDGRFQCDTLEDYFERLAEFLAKCVLARGRRGWYREYLTEQDHVNCVRGRLDAARLRPWEVQMPCAFQEHTPDIEENRLLAWTLYTIMRSGICRERTVQVVRKAYHALSHAVTPQPFRGQDCVGRQYNRLNDDYAPMHALCYFFLDGVGPTHHAGTRDMIPFLVDMSVVFEKFVAEWLRRHLPARYRVTPQQRVDISEAGEFCFRIDLVIYDVETETVRWVLDTKYKRPAVPSTDDIAQVGFYAQLTDCIEAVLLYPSTKTKQLDCMAGDIRVRSLAFELDGEIDGAGNRMLAALGIV